MLCMTQWWQWLDSIYNFPGSFCQDSSPTQLHALSYVLLMKVLDSTGSFVTSHIRDHSVYKFQKIL